MKATLNFGRLQPIRRCQIEVPGAGVITMRILPEISDSRGVTYTDEAVIGRAFPIKTFSHGDNRTISMKCTFAILEDRDADLNLMYLRWLQSATYPRENNANPYLPPPICRIRCGNLLAGRDTDGWLCVVLKQCNVSYPTDVVWHSTVDGEGSYLPYKFDVDLNWDVVYSNQELPGQEKIITDF